MPSTEVHLAEDLSTHTDLRAALQCSPVENQQVCLYRCACIYYRYHTCMVSTGWPGLIGFPNQPSICLKHFPQPPMTIAVTHWCNSPRIPISGPPRIPPQIGNSERCMVWYPITTPYALCSLNFVNAYDLLCIIVDNIIVSSASEYKPNS